MACFTVTAAEAVVVTVAAYAVKKHEEKKEAKLNTASADTPAFGRKSPGAGNSAGCPGCCGAARCSWLTSTSGTAKWCRGSPF